MYKRLNCLTGALLLCGTLFVGTWANVVYGINPDEGPGQAKIKTEIISEKTAEVTDINAKVSVDETEPVEDTEDHDPGLATTESMEEEVAGNDDMFEYDLMNEQEWDEDVISVNISDDDKREFVEYIGPICMADQVLTGIPASVTIAQCILESGWGQSGLSVKANNYFGIKAGASRTSWSQYSVWDGESYYETMTGEETASGEHIRIRDKFRAYPSVKESIADHSAYLAYSQKNGELRYPGLVGCKDYRIAFQIIQAGGYATSSSYASSLCSLVEKYDLTRFDIDDFGDAGVISEE